LATGAEKSAKHAARNLMRRDFAPVGLRRGAEIAMTKPKLLSRNDTRWRRVDVLSKMDRPRQWCEDVNKAQSDFKFDFVYDFVYVDQESFDRYNPIHFDVSLKPSRITNRMPDDGHSPQKYFRLQAFNSLRAHPSLIPRDACYSEIGQDARALASFRQNPGNPPST
jgi:hypothetical protein